MEEPLKGYEKEHIELLRKTASECTLFLKLNGEFPIEKACKVLLIGCGARETLKGGTGSGGVESRFFISCEQGLENSGFEIVSKKWLDEYPNYKEKSQVDFIKNQKKLAKEVKSLPVVFAFGAVQPEEEYELSLDYEADIAIYVLARNSGEGSDRHLIKGDVLLTDSEIRDILKLNQKFKKFLLVLNVCGVVDLSPINEVSNILLLSQLGVVTGDILADIILGKANPSGKLSTSWASIKDYKYINEFGQLDDVRYKEGIYVGYRYFNSANVKPLYPFGFGKSYTDFELNKISLNNNKDEIIIKVKVKNIGKFSGKEVVQIYISPPQTNKDKPYQSLVAFKKTKLLNSNEEDELTLNFYLKNSARYDEEKASYILDNGNYIIRVGNSSDNTNIYGIVNLSEYIITEKLKNIGGKTDFEDFKLLIEYKDDLTNIETIKLSKEDFTTYAPEYNYSIKINENVEKLSDDDLVNLCIGNYQKEGENSFQTIEGQAGETTLHVKDIKKSIVMVDGPAGIRIARIYGEDEKGKYRLNNCSGFGWKKYYMDKELFSQLDEAENNVNRKGKINYQYTTAIPIGTAIAQTFNVELVELYGDVVAKEMDIFNIHLWLAPGLNIHRNILCGRNFEYYSEDPLLSGKMAAAITIGIQKHKNRGTTIKHFACNNQEFQRKNSNSILSERALREIYLRGFRIAIEDSNPIALMTSYNLINGVHSSERKDLVIDVLRNEWKYEGLIMTDWFRSGEMEYNVSKHPAQSSTNNLISRNNLQMGGRIINYKDVSNSLKENKLTRQDLLENASIVYSSIEKLNQ